MSTATLAMTPPWVLFSTWQIGVSHPRFSRLYRVTLIVVPVSAPRISVPRMVVARLLNLLRLWFSRVGVTRLRTVLRTVLAALLATILAGGVLLQFIVLALARSLMTILLMSPIACSVAPNGICSGAETWFSCIRATPTALLLPPP